MKRLLLSVLAFASLGLLTAQDTFTDDFESYNVGDYVGANSTQWTTWSGTTGGAEDMRVSSVEAKSGSNSAYLEGESGGGPQDVVLDFGGKRTTGTFTFTSSFFIAEGKGGYFNIQQEVNPGVAWTFDCYMRPGGNMDLIQPGISLAYPVGEWFEMTLVANLDYDVWSMSIDGECSASFEMPANAAISTLDIYPADGDYDFYVDDVSYNWEAAATDPGTPVKDAEVIIVNNGNVGIIGGDKEINVMITNRGSDDLDAVSLAYEIGGTAYTQDVSGLSLATGAATSVLLDNSVTVSDQLTLVEVRAASVNGAAGDENVCNDFSSANISGFTPAENKKIWAEEGTGTWCQFCPRGDVFMNLMNERYPDHFVGIAVHNRTTDPMLNVTWDAGVTSFPGFTGFPNMVFERALVFDPSGLENNIINYLQRPVNTTMVHEATWDENTRELVVGVHTHFAEQEIGAYKLVVGLTEDDVTGTSNGYAQSNAFAGGGLGPMGGYENLPNPVPASQMVYNHVGRQLFTPFGGEANAFSDNSIVPAGWYYHEFTTTLPDGWDVDQMHIVSATIFTDGTTDNAQTSSINSAVDTEDLALTAQIDIAPNPTTGWTNIRIDLEERTDLSIQITDATGRLISARTYVDQSGDQIYPFDGSNLNAGIYYIRINTTEGFTTRKLVVSK